MPTLVSVFGVEPRRIGGTETFARELSAQLNERGWKSVLCFLGQPGEEVRSFIDLPNISFEVFANHKNGNGNHGKSLGHLVRQHRPDILHLHYTGFVNSNSWQASMFGAGKIFFTDHHSRPAGYVQARAPFWKRGAARIINSPLNKVVCVSDYGYRCMTAYGLLPPERFEMIYNGVDLSRVCTDPKRGIEFRKRFGIPAERSVVVQVSWMIPEKGITDVLETARRVIANNRKVQFVLVGDGAYREQYVRDASEMGLSEHVTWTGEIRDPFGEGVFDAADVVCQFSRWEEVFGWMIAEAMAHGKPVVATRVGGIPELIADGVSGYLVDREDHAAMSKQLLSLLADAPARARMGLAGRRTVETKFDLRKNVGQLIRLYGIS